MLSIKQEKYVQNLIKGMSQREAYKKSYNATKMKDNTIDSRAYELFKKSEIRERYEELLEKVKEKTTERTIMSALERKEFLTKIITGDIKEKQTIFKDSKVTTEEIDANLNTVMKALDILNKMDGQYITRLTGDVSLNYEKALKEVVDKDEY